MGRPLTHKDSSDYSGDAQVARRYGFSCYVPWNRRESPGNANGADAAQELSAATEPDKSFDHGAVYSTDLVAMLPPKRPK